LVVFPEQGKEVVGVNDLEFNFWVLLAEDRRRPAIFLISFRIGQAGRGPSAGNSPEVETSKVRLCGGYPSFPRPVTIQIA
jgi:hypothetical protein